ncbi:unnamed protein product [Vitrella brassicaformis CCMP3155]|uniref:Uncharacterized protein n=1 Tax=Vitrella brassicaformis (strain CCMP3155) TaxID=1169540 RepID=A0A0G4F283_VITBC|nr:unnamed protein product [Vitrella brassicaformis CCMP3155]|eukprot:CEM05736.1 unnamed protein product [Vitrella brassicaformis CCMP3155]
MGKPIFGFTRPRDITPRLMAGIEVDKCIARDDWPEEDIQRLLMLRERLRKVVTVPADEELIAQSRWMSIHKLLDAPDTIGTMRSLEIRVEEPVHDRRGGSVPWLAQLMELLRLEAKFREYVADMTAEIVESEAADATATGTTLSPILEDPPMAPRPMLLLAPINSRQKRLSPVERLLPFDPVK